MKWNPFDNNKLITVGIKHIKFWTQAGNIGCFFFGGGGGGGGFWKFWSLEFLCVVYDM